MSSKGVQVDVMPRALEGTFRLLFHSSSSLQRGVIVGTKIKGASHVIYSQGVPATGVSQ